MNFLFFHLNIKLVHVDYHVTLHGFFFSFLTLTLHPNTNQNFIVPLFYDILRRDIKLELLWLSYQGISIFNVVLLVLCKCCLNLITVQ